MKYFYMIAIFLVLIPSVLAVPQVDYRVPSSIVAIVGQLTGLEIDLINKDSIAHYYTVKITGNPANQIDITNPSIISSSVNPGSLTSVYTNIRTLTEAPNALTVDIYQDSDLSSAVTAMIPVSSKKFSLPDFGMTGLIQIAVLSSLAYFMIGRKFTAKS